MAKYRMKISRLTVDKLGVRLYDKVSAVIAELISNGYDADATEVVVTAPMGELLATKKGKVLEDKGLEVIVEDDGIGMTPDEVNQYYLIVGKERRLDARGSVSKKGRKVMGRKGVGKLAPFGVCSEIEVISSGGKEVAGKDATGKAARGFMTAHLFLDREKILSDTDEDYEPRVGPLDGIVRPKTGTILKLRKFAHRHVPKLDDLARQLGQRFGLATAGWTIRLVDSTKPAGDKDKEKSVGAFAVEKMEGTEIRFERVPGATDDNDAGSYRALDSAGKQLVDADDKPLPPGFTIDGRFYPVVGWMAYARSPYKDELMAGVRIYCRGKIAAQTHIFNMKAGFTGEYDIRSYLVGELHADWLDEEEDLILTDRRDILWSHEIGQIFQGWGQALVKRVGKTARDPLKKKTWELFMEASKITERVEEAFPQPEQEPIRENALKLAKSVAQNIRVGELSDHDHVEALVQLSLSLAPHITLTEKLRQAGDEATSTLEAVADLMKAAKIAELSSFGLIASERVQIIEKLESLKDDPATLEDQFQQLITEAPWLVDPQWSPITSNKTFSTLKSEFQKYYKKKTGKDLVLTEFKKPNKRADFVMTTEEGKIEIVEIKKADYELTNAEFDRIDTYIELFEAFFNDSANKELTQSFVGFSVTLVCDRVALSGAQKRAFEALKKDGRLTRLTWAAFLAKTRRMHQSFLDEAERQKKNAAAK